MEFMDISYGFGCCIFFGFLCFVELFLSFEFLERGISQVHGLRTAAIYL